GMIGRLTKWTGFTSSNSFIGDSTIFEDKFGKVGIGTDMPTSRLTVAGTVESMGGGFKFPDGSVQTSSASAALFSVAHDSTLSGDGTAALPLGVSVPLTLSGTPPNNALALVTITSGTKGVQVTADTLEGISATSLHYYGVFGSSPGSNGVHGVNGNPL